MNTTHLPLIVLTNCKCQNEKKKKKKSSLKIGKKFQKIVTLNKNWQKVEQNDRKLHNMVVFMFMKTW